MRILFLDQTAELGGAELSLLSEVTNLPGASSVLLFEDGPFRRKLETAGIRVEVLEGLAGTKAVRRESGMMAIALALPVVLRLILAVARRAKAYDVLYANSQKAFVVGVFAAIISKRRLVWRLRDVLSAAHFGATLRWIAILLANRKASRVIVNSVATGDAFTAVGGNAAKVSVAYPGIDEAPFAEVSAATLAAIRTELNAGTAPLIGVFGRLSEWKGQAVFIEAIAKVPGAIGVVVGAALFGHEAYASQLTQQVAALQLQDRIRFLGFRQDIAALMSAMDIIVHSSIAPEPFGRVVVEGMLAGKPVVASAAGGVLEIIEHAVTGWLYEPGNAIALAGTLRMVLDAKGATDLVAQAGRIRARERFTVQAMVKQIEAALRSLDHD